MEKKRERQVQFELLRVIAMLMVLVLHFLAGTGVLPAPSAAGNGHGSLGLGEREIFGVLAESFCIVAVNVYVLISGYFLSELSFSLRRLLRLVCQVLFYTLLIPPLLVCLGILPAAEAFSLYRLWEGLFPVQSGAYWFISAYVVMLLLSPALNAAARWLKRRQLKWMILGLLLFFSLGKSLSPFLFSTDRYGYDYGWFCCLYLMAAYFRRYGSVFFSGKKRCAALYLVSCLLIAAMEFASLWLWERTGRFAYYTTVPFHYNFFFAFTGAMACFGLFSRLRIAPGQFSRCVCAVSPAMLGVYLIHGHRDINGRWTAWLAGDPSEHLLGYGIQLLESVLIVFVFCTAVDLLRIRLFALLEKALLRTRTGRRAALALHKADEMLAE